MSYGSKKQEEKELGQSNLFDLAMSDDASLVMLHLILQLKMIMRTRRKLGFEASLIGIYVSGHPLDKYEDIIAQLTSF